MTPSETNDKLETLIGGQVTSIMYDAYQNVFMTSVRVGDDIETVTVFGDKAPFEIEVKVS